MRALDVDFFAALTRSAFKGHATKRVEEVQVPIRADGPVRLEELNFGTVESESGAKVITAHPAPIRCGCADGWLIVQVPNPYTDDPDALPIEETRPCSCQQIPKVAQAITRVELPGKLLENGAVFAGTGPDWQLPAWRVCKQFLAGKVRALVLSSSITGSGKTVIACSMALRYALWGRSVCVKTMGQLRDELYETFGRRSNRSRGEMIRELASLELLVIDELTFGNTEWISMLTEVVNARYNSGRPIIVTTNLDAAEVEQAVGARAWSRLCEMGPEAEPVIDFPDAQDMRRTPTGAG